jgi:hypothetical protein
VAENNRQADERRRARASQVFVTAEPYLREGEPISSIEVSVTNTSQQPIYDLTLLWHEGAGEWTDLGDPVYFPVLIPGQEYKAGTGIEPTLPIGRFLLDPYLTGAAVTFRDAAGEHWRLDSYGQPDPEPASR